MGFFDRFPKNMGSTDRTVRIIAGIALLLLAITNNIGFFGLFGQVFFGLVGIALLASAWLRFCFIYTLLDRDTAPPADGDDTRYQG